MLAPASLLNGRLSEAPRRPRSTGMPPPSGRRAARGKRRASCPRQSKPLQCTPRRAPVLKLRGRLINYELGPRPHSWNRTPTKVVARIHKAPQSALTKPSYLATSPKCRRVAARYSSYYSSDIRLGRRPDTVNQLPQFVARRRAGIKHVGDLTFFLFFHDFVFRRAVALGLYYAIPRVRRVPVPRVMWIFIRLLRLAPFYS